MRATRELDRFVRKLSLFVKFLIAAAFSLRREDFDEMERLSEFLRKETMIVSGALSM